MTIASEPQTEYRAGLRLTRCGVGDLTPAWWCGPPNRLWGEPAGASVVAV